MLAKADELNKQLAEVFQVPVEAITLEYRPEWDSLAIVSTIAMVDDVYGVVLNGPDIAKCETVAQLMDLILAESA